MDRKKLNQIFTIFSSLSKEPKTELCYVNNFTLAVAVILSAQATDVSVNKATKELFANYATAQSFLQLGEENLKRYIKAIGLYSTKAKNIIAMCKILVEEYDGVLPSDFGKLIKLPGIGRKTANVILNCAFGKSTIAVDTHVARMANRLGISSSKDPKKIEQELLQKIPQIWLKNAHNWLVLHGRYVCKARKPLCSECKIAELCPSRGKFELKNSA